MSKRKRQTHRLDGSDQSGQWSQRTMPDHDDLTVESRRVLEQLRLDKIEVFCRYFLAVHAEIPADFDSAADLIKETASSLFQKINLTDNVVDVGGDFRELVIDVALLLAGVFRANDDLAEANDHTDMDVCNLDAFDGAVNDITQRLMSLSSSNLVWIHDLRDTQVKRKQGNVRGAETRKQAKLGEKKEITKKLDQYEAYGTPRRDLVRTYIASHKAAGSPSERTLQRILRDREKYR